MADNDQSKIRYDDFIGSVQPDPAKTESTIMLSGFVGHGPEGHARIYPDPTLGTWYDIPEGDILHSMPIADSKLGGSYVWVRASSEIKPGSAAPAATEAEAAQPQQAAAAVNPTPRTHCHVCDPPMAAAAQPTPTVQTHCFICPPHTQAVHCWTAPVVCDTMQMPTPATHCFICPPHTQNCTPATICTLHGHCPPQHSVPPTLCAVPQTLPCTMLCQADPRAAAAPAQVLPNTPATLCTQFGCQPNAMPPTLWCTLFGCPSIDICAAAGAAAAPQAAAAALPHTAATVCTQVGCPLHGMVPTLWCSWVGCPPPGLVGGAPAGGAGAPQAAAGMLPQTHFLCTQGFPTFCGCTPGIDCNAPPGNVQTQAPICTQGFPTFCGCTPGIDCGLAARAAPQQANAMAVTVCVTDCQPPQMAAAVQPTPTVQTHCFICPPHTLTPPCPPGTQPIVCTQAVMCPTNPVPCDTMQMPTPATRCLICPPQHPTPLTVPPWVCGQPGGGFTPATVCTHAIHCPTQPVVCNLQPTQPVVCGVLPPSFGCTQQGCAPGAGGAPQVQARAFEGATVVCSQPARCTQACMPQAQHGGGVTAATVCTMPQACPPHTVHNSMCICPTPSAVHQCGGQTVFTPTIPQLTAVGACPTFGVCPSIACTTPFTPVQNGVFTPFGR